MGREFEFVRVTRKSDIAALGFDFLLCSYFVFFFCRVLRRYRVMRENMTLERFERLNEGENDVFGSIIVGLMKGQ